MRDHWKEGAPPGSEFAASKNGYMTIDIFKLWFNHFLKHVRPTANAPTLLILDGHSSHTKNLAFTEEARANNVTVVVLPPHCNHRLQPLDVSFMAPFKMYYSDAAEKLMRQRPGETITINDISGLVNIAFSKVATTRVAVNGFEKTGLVPLNRNVFSENEFSPSTVSDRPPAPEELTFDGNNSPSTLDKEIECSQIQSCVIDEANPQNLVKLELDTPEKNESGFSTLFTISPNDVLPLPKVERPRDNKRKRVRQKAADITDEYKENLKKAKAEKSIKEIKKAQKPKTRKAKSLKTLPEVKQDSLCFQCGSIFSDSCDGLDWMMCYKCGKWFHEDCAQTTQRDEGYCGC
ncbi:uncharacterized protein LOC129727632 [Wyeomyia smithii]|uniref:uncharacterized protein LOC129727632 n=1 Tax=Wyeomyia smithii TaxID=174621 RepID=UPI002467CBB0|nr:uncharacterized protein LOC129727632 [Wyeomyia smithii]